MSRNQVKKKALAREGLVLGPVQGHTASATGAGVCRSGVDSRPVCLD